VRILLIHFETSLKARLALTLERNNIETRSLHPGDDPRSILNATHPELLVYYIAPEMVNAMEIESIRKALHPSGLPEVFLYSARSGSDYLQALQKRFYNIINLPCSGTHLVQRLRSMADSTSQPSQNAAVALTVRIDDTLHSVSVNENDLARFLESLFGNLAACTATHSGKKNPKASHDIVPEKKPSSLSTMETELAAALQNDELRLFYQPVVSLEDGRLSGFESLIRWAHPRNGLVGPDNFIPIAERSYLIFPIGFWVVEEACRQIRFWLDNKLIDEQFRVNVNLSVRQFTHPELAERIIATVKSYNIPPSNIAFEITESAFMEDMEAANLMLLKLKSERHMLYMDDFGTGFSPDLSAALSR
jgi:predicted signal transduction protein with EAL and GGDEF domain